MSSDMAAWMDDQSTGALSENERLQCERDVYCFLLSNLVRRLEEVHADPRYQGVWMHFAAHGCVYDEPTYTAEFEAARAYLRGTSSAEAGYMGDINGPGCDPDVP